VSGEKMSACRWHGQRIEGLFHIVGDFVPAATLTMAIAPSFTPQEQGLSQVHLPKFSTMF
jgi:hypothetical protein